MPKSLISHRTMTYATRRLKAGDMFQASDRDANLLVRLGRASEIPEALAKVSAPVRPTAPPAAPPAVTAAPAVTATPSAPAQRPADNDGDDGEENPLKAVRDEYEQVVGKRPFHGWDEDELRRRMAEHQSS